ncbi:AAA family ATPase [Agromyces bauzanensis]|uniref:AAA domain-containing protein n=1 Tax=Agromyces bauzanensis TaxID=1308924 RepID=A0A917PPI2_9MICO|nr:AAA family ATPase [Agromyces bauzanensis]GGJ86022.1 hypothetical protein GCM10011372_25440 [Agromyces bauzanensis]
MSSYLLISRSTEYESRVRDMLGAQASVITGEFLTFGPEAVLDRVTGTPRIALLGPVLNYEETRALVEGLNARYPDIGVIVVREQRSDLEDWVDELALHAVLSPSAPDDITLQLLDRLASWLISNGKAEEKDFEAPAELVDESAPAVVDALAVDQSNDAPAILSDGYPGFDQLTQVEPSPAWVFPPALTPGAVTEAIAVIAPKGGQGKTTLAINIATGLAEVAPNSVVLIDADLQFGDITTALDLHPEGTIVDAADPSSADELILKTTLTHHPDGFYVVASAPSPELGDGIAAQALSELIQRLRDSFRYVVVDTTPGLGEHTLAVIEQTTDAVFVTNMGVPSLRALRTEFELLERIGLLPANRHVVVNFTDRLSGITLKDAEAILGTPVDFDIPRSSAVLLASNRGVPLIHDDVRDPAAKAIRALVVRIAPEALATRNKIHKRRRSREAE